MYCSVGPWHINRTYWLIPFAEHCDSNKQTGRVCVLNLSGRPCNLQGRTAGSQGSLDKSRLCQMSGTECKVINAWEYRELSHICSTRGTKTPEQVEKMKTPEKCEIGNTLERWKMKTPNKGEKRKYPQSEKWNTWKRWKMKSSVS